VTREDTIHVNNFPYHFEEKDIRLLFKDCGDIARIAMPEDRMSKQSRGFAFITFIDYKAARKAMNLDGHKVMNRPIKVTIAQ
jgi:RNA recognition motif-containing protein